MKEFDEDEAIAKMCAACVPPCTDKDTAYEVLDLIYDYYDENGELDIDADGDDADAAEIVAYITGSFRKNAPAAALTDAQILAMVKAEIEYEESLLD